MISAYEFAKICHYGQFRKGSKAPYVAHPLRVAERLNALGVGPDVCAAAALHDVMEDCGIAFDLLNRLFKRPIALLVQEVTNPSKQYPQLHRDAKKHIDRLHIKNISPGAKLIKLADRADNLRDVKGLDKEWIKQYCKESELLLNECLIGTHGLLEAEYRDAIEFALAEAQ